MYSLTGQKMGHSVVELRSGQDLGSHESVAGMSWVHQMTTWLTWYSIARLMLWRWGREKVPWREPWVLASSTALRKNSNRIILLLLPWRDLFHMELPVITMTFQMARENLCGIQCDIYKSWLWVSCVKMYLPRGKQIILSLQKYQLRESRNLGL